MRDRLPFASRRQRHPVRTRRRAAWAWALVFAAAALGSSPAAAQFGQNKVQYSNLRWRVLETAHFDIHYYEQEREAAQQAGRMAERSYEYLSDFYQHEFTEKIPVILYATHQEFEQSNIASGFVGEGTGGFTESLRGRVTLPLTGSYGELNHVLTHELVHAFQFDMLQRSMRGMLGMGPFPLWMTEGMAEWVSNGMDPVTAMWVVDAARRERKKGHSQIPTVRDMATVQDIRVYRMGQALFEVIAATRGKDRIRKMLKRPEMRGVGRDSIWGPLDAPPPGRGTDMTTDLGAAAPDSVLFALGTNSGASLEKQWKTYTDSLAKTLGANLLDPDSTAERITDAGRYGRMFNLAPVISPDGSKILYYSSRGFHNELFIAERQGDAWVKKSLVVGEENPEMESLPLLSASADWSPDGKLVAFVATEQGRDVLQVFDVARRRVVRRLRTELSAFSNPSWSPDGRLLVFTALEGGQDDLFLIDVQSDRLTRLTQDAYSERTPHFTPQGDAIAFATDRGPQSDPQELRFGSWNIARMTLRREGDNWVADRIEGLVESPANDFAPMWSPDGASLAFVSDRDGTYQVYSVELATGIVRRRTRFDAGVIGIVPTGPAFSWAQNGDVAYSIFHNGGWSLFRTHGFPLDEDGAPDPEKMALTRSIPPAVLDAADANVAERDRTYRTRLKPESAVLGALYVGSGGAAGSGQLMLGDMLGNHYLLLSGYLRSQVEQSEFLLQYASLGQRWQWGVAAYQFRDDLGNYAQGSDITQSRSLIRLGVGSQIAYPFNRFRRLEFSLDLQTVSDRVANVLYDGGGLYETGVRQSRQYYAIPGVALVHDNTSYAGFTPVAGKRWRVSFEQTIGVDGYSLGVGDYRRYFNIRMRGAIAVRGVFAGSGGGQQQILRVGGPDSFRGTDFGGIAGSKVAFSNVELRFPIFTELLRGVLFMDSGAGWRDAAGLKLSGSDGPSGVRLQDLRMAYGFGIRGFVGLPLRIDVAWPTDLVRSGRTLTTFSIGWDF